MRYFIGAEPSKDVANCFRALKETLESGFDIDPEHHVNTPLIMVQDSFESQSVLAIRGAVAEFVAGAVPAEYTTRGLGAAIDHRGMPFFELRVVLSPQLRKNHNQLDKLLSRSPHIGLSGLTGEKQYYGIPMFRGYDNKASEKIKSYLSDASRDVVECSGVIDRLIIFRQESCGPIVDISYDLKG